MRERGDAAQKTGEAFDGAVPAADADALRGGTPGADARAANAANGAANSAQESAHAADALRATTAQHAAHAPLSAADGAPATIMPSRLAGLGAFATLAALTLLCVAWEWRLAPLRPGGSSLVLKALPLAIALPGVLRRRIYTLQWASMLVLLYFAEGIVRGMTDPAPGNRLGWIEAALALGFFACALVYVAPFKRAARRRKREAA